MTEDLVVKVRNDPENCIADGGISDEGCHLALTGAPAPNDRAIVSFRKKIPKNEGCCDYLFVARSPNVRNWVVPIELKSEKPKIKKVAEQLQAGADVLQNTITSRITFKLIPILASKSVGKHNRGELKKMRIRLHGQSVAILRLRCGDRLAKVLK